MKVLLLIIFSNLCLGTDIDTEVIINELSGFHGTAWKKIVKKKDDHQKSREILEKIIQGEVSIESFKTFDSKLIRQRAIGEYGRFATNIDGSKNDSVIKFLDNLDKTEFEHSEISALIQSYGFTDSPKGVDRVSNMLKSYPDHEGVILDVLRMKIDGDSGIKKNISPFYNPDNNWNSKTGKIDFSGKESYKILKRMRKRISARSRVSKPSLMILRFNKYVERIFKEKYSKVASLKNEKITEKIDSKNEATELVELQHSQSDEPSRFIASVEEEKKSSQKSLILILLVTFLVLIPILKRVL